MRKPLIIAAFLLTLGASSISPNLAADDYKSPYHIAFTYGKEELTQMDSQPPRDNPRLEANIPYDEWYTNRTRRKLGAWGPHSRQYPAIPEFNKQPVEWKRQRLLAVAERWTGRPYQHHHIPDWDPPADWPWHKVGYGRNSMGVDCSDFTSWVYNYGLGIRLRTGIGEQAKLTEIKGPGGEGLLHCETITDDNGYDDLVKKLRTGDLLYIKSNKGNVSHVIMWVGEYGKSPDGTPLIIDSTGNDHKDSNGVTIPYGIHLRPFLKNNWYYKSFSHAHRILGG